MPHNTDAAEPEWSLHHSVIEQSRLHSGWETVTSSGPYLLTPKGVTEFINAV
jgi:hypothetical protein